MSERERGVILITDADGPTDSDNQAGFLNFGPPISAIVIATIGQAGVGVQPVMVSALTEAGGFDIKVAGYIASAEILGIVVTNLATVITGSRSNWRSLCLIGLVLLIVGSIASIFARTDFESMIAARLISGFGAGLLTSSGVPRQHLRHRFEVVI